MSGVKTEDINRVREALLEARQLLAVVQQGAVVERELQARADELVAANMELEALRAEARREQRAAEERCAALEVERDNARECANIRMAELGEEVDQAQAELRQRDERIAFLEWAVSDLEGGGR